MECVLLAFLLLIILLVNLLITRNDVLSPSVSLCGGFLFSALWLSVFANKWKIDLLGKTFFIVCSGVLVYSLTCLIINYIFKRRKKRKLLRVQAQRKLTEIDIPNIVKIIIIIISLAAVIVNTTIRIKFVGGNLANLWIALTDYRVLSSFTTETLAIFPQWSGLVYQFTYASGYWFGYVLIHNYIATHKWDKLNIVIVLISLISSLTMGSRGGLVDYVIAFLIYYLILKRYEKGALIKAGKLNYKKIGKILIVFIVFLLSFRLLGNAIGRENNEQTTLDYISTYCGAQIANFNIFLESGTKSNNIWGSQSFYGLVRWLGGYFGLSSSQMNYRLDSVYHISNGYKLGNVHTMFYSFYYDFGEVGVILLTILMAIICQACYNRVRSIVVIKKPQISLVLYGFFYSTIVLSFFSNKFYEKLCNKSFVYTIIFWLALNWILKIRTKKGK